MYIVAGSEATLTRSLITANTAGDKGGGLSNAGGNIILRGRTRVWGNFAPVGKQLDLAAGNSAATEEVRPWATVGAPTL